MRRIGKWLVIGLATMIGYIVTSRKLEDNRDFR